MIFFRHRFEIKSDQPLFRIVDILEENIETEKKFTWPWKKRKPFTGSISGNSFQVTKNSYFTNYKAIVSGKFKQLQNKTLIRVQIRQTSLFYLAVLFGIFFLSGGLLFLDGTSNENIIASIVVAGIYYSICLFFFIVDTRGTQKKLRNILAGDNNFFQPTRSPRG